MRVFIRRCLFFVMLLLSAFQMSCTDADNYQWRIGVSQCVGGKWREKVNQEMFAAQHLFKNEVKVDIVSADNNSLRQVKQIDSLVASGVDLLVIAPNTYDEISPAIERALKVGIPVILFDRKVDGGNYTAYIGGDNIEAGKAMAHYAVSLLHERAYDHRPRILEITGGKVSSPARDRHAGFFNVMQQNKAIDYAFIDTDWSSGAVYATMKQWLKTHPVPDIVFCHSDLAAFHARRAAEELHMERSIRFLGIDGLSDPGEGIDAVKRGLLAGTYIYPTHGAQIIRLALDILQKKPFQRTTIMKSVIVTPDNAPILMQSSMELQRQTTDLLTLQEKLESYSILYHNQKQVSFIAFAAVFLLVVALVLIWRAVIQLRKTGRKMKQLNQEQTHFYTNARHQLRTPLTLIEGPLKKLAKSEAVKGDVRQLIEILQRNVEQLSRIVYDVLNFQKETLSLVDDNSSSDSLAYEIMTASVQRGRVGLLKRNEEGLLSLLIVDDNDDMRRYLCTLLSDQYYIIEASDGESGLRLAKESVPNLIVSDVMMPIMDGLEFCQKIKENEVTSHIPVILLTARSTEEQQMEGIESGADAYMVKPFNAEMLLLQIENLLASRRKLRLLFNGQTAKEDLNEDVLKPNDRKFIDTLKLTIKKRMSDSSLKMDELGAELGMSRVQLYRKVKALTGLSPVELLREMRLERAYKLLETTERSVSQVGYDVGFASPSYFSSCFKKQFGIYPTEMRR